MNKTDGMIVFKPRLSYSLGWGLGLALVGIACLFMLMLLINIRPESLYSPSIMILFVPQIAILFWGVTYLSDAINGLPQIIISKTTLEVRSIWGVRKTSLSSLYQITEGGATPLTRDSVKIGAMRIGNRYQVSLAEIIEAINSRRK